MGWAEEAAAKTREESSRMQEMKQQFSALNEELLEVHLHHTLH